MSAAPLNQNCRCYHTYSGVCIAHQICRKLGSNPDLINDAKQHLQLSHRAYMAANRTEAAVACVSFNSSKRLHLQLSHAGSHGRDLSLVPLRLLPQLPFHLTMPLLEAAGHALTSLTICTLEEVLSGPPIECVRSMTSICLAPWLQINMRMTIDCRLSNAAHEHLQSVLILCSRNGRLPRAVLLAGERCCGLCSGPLCRRQLLPQAGRTARGGICFRLCPLQVRLHINMFGLELRLDQLY